jgi:hypothetical protein
MRLFCFQAASKPALATSVTFPSSEVVGGTFASTILVATIIIAYFNFCNNNFHIGK